MSLSVSSHPLQGSPSLSLGGQTCTVGAFETNPNPKSGQFFDLRVLFKIFEHVSGWQLEYTLCSLRQYLESKSLSCRCRVIEQETHTGLVTEFWITTNRWFWRQEFDGEVVGVLTMFVPVPRSEIAVLGWHIPPILRGLVVEKVEVELGVEVEIGLNVSVNGNAGAALTPVSPTSEAIPSILPFAAPKTEPESWLTDALVAAWAEIPSPHSGAYTPLSDWTEDGSEYGISDDDEPEPLSDLQPERSAFAATEEEHVYPDADAEGHGDFSLPSSSSSGSLFGPSPDSSPLASPSSVPQSSALPAWWPEGFGSGFGAGVCSNAGPTLCDSHLSPKPLDLWLGSLRENANWSRPAHGDWDVLMDVDDVCRSLVP